MEILETIAAEILGVLGGVLGGMFVWNTIAEFIRNITE